MKLFINITVNQNDIRRMDAALNRLMLAAGREKKVLPHGCAWEYKDLVVRNILTQKFASTYPRYSERYAKWKTQTMLRGSQFWNLYGDLIAAITVFPGPFGRGFMGGIPATVKDSGGKSWNSTPDSRRGRAKSIAMYGRSIEFGHGNQPARPVFGPTKDEYADRGYPLRAAASLRRIGAQWR